MGYDVHITRAEFWAEREGFEIGESEWRNYLLTDPEFRVDKEMGPNFAVWIPEGDTGSWLDWSEGDLSSKNPTPAFLVKLHKVATRLKARVQGDDGEFYGPNGERIEE